MIMRCEVVPSDRCCGVEIGTKWYTVHAAGGTEWWTVSGRYLADIPLSTRGKCAASTHTVPVK
jgi:hypothetical protein